MDDEEKFAYLDDIIDRTHARRKELDDKISRYQQKHATGQLSVEDARDSQEAMQERDQLDQGIKRLTNSPHHVGYLEHYNEKYMSAPKPQPAAGDEGPSFWDNLKQKAGEIGKGAADTAKFAIQNPQRALSHVNQGMKELTSVPYRGLETLLTGGGKFPVASGKQYIEDSRQQVAQGDQARGVDPRSIGPVVSETVGQMSVPLPLTVGPAAKLFSKESAKNFAKGGAVGGGLYAAERVANNEPVDDTGLAVASSFGGTFNALLGRVAGRSTSSGGSGGSADVLKGGGGGPDPTPAPNKGGAQMKEPTVSPSSGPGTGNEPDSVRGLLEHNPAIVTPAPPKGLPAPEPSMRSPYRDMVDSIRSKTESNAPLTPEEKRFLLLQSKRPASPPPNAGGTREVIDVTPIKAGSEATPPVAGRASASKASEPLGGPTQKAPALQTLLQKPQPAATPQAVPQRLSPMAEAAQGIEAEKAARLAAPQAKSVLPTIAKPQAPLNQALQEANNVTAELEKASKEALLAKVIKGEVNVKDVPIKRGGHPKSEAPTPAVQGEVGVVPTPRPRKIAQTKAEQLYAKKLAEGKTPEQAKELAEFKSDTKLAPEAVQPTPSTRLEDFIAQKGYKLEEKEPFPGEKSYNVIDPKTGNTIARGDRDAILNAMNVRNEGKGIKLTSGVDPSDVIDMLKRRMGMMPKDVTVAKSPHKEGIANMSLRDAGLETPQFAMRKTSSGRAAVNAALDAEDLSATRVNNLFHALKEDGSYVDTGFYHYYEAQPAAREKVNDVLVLGDKLGETYTPEQLVKLGLSHEQAEMYKGVREALDNVHGWIKELPDAEEFTSHLKGYIPRVWNGNLELFVNGEKHVPVRDGKELGSSFKTLREASSEMWKIKQANPTAKIEARYFTDPDYLLPRGLADARAVAKAKANIEEMGKLTASEVEDAFKIGKGYKGFVKHLMERKDAKGYETEHLDKILFSYVNQAAKTIENKRMRLAVEEIVKNSAGDLSAQQVKYLESYMDRVAGKPAWDQAWIDTMLKSTPISKWIDPVTVGAGVKTAKDWITYKSLGFGNVSWALVNLDSLTRHVWPMLQEASQGKLGTFATEKFLRDAIREYFKNPQLRQKLAHNRVIDIQLMSESSPEIGRHVGKANWTAQKAIMFLGMTTEEFVRGVAAISRYRMALKQGLGDADAMRVASRFVAETVGRYSKAGKPPAFTGAIGSTLGMFKTYPVVMLQNMFKAFESKDAGVITRYMLASLAAGGAIGAVPGSEEVDKLAQKFLGISPIQWGYQHFGEGIMTGLASTLPKPLATDMSRKAGLPDVFPNDTKDWLGPVLNTYVQAATDASQGEYKEALRDLMPTSLRNILAVSQKPEMVVGRYGKPTERLDPGTAPRVMRGLGFQTPAEVRHQREYEFLETQRSRNEERLKQLTRRIYQGQATPEERDEFNRLGGTGRRLREENKRESLTTRERQERHLPKLLRHQFQE